MTDYNEILDLIDENLPDNHQQKITAAKLREVFDELTEGVSSDVTDLNNNKQDTLQRYHENGVGYDVNITGTQGNLYLNSSYTSLDFGSNTSYIKLSGDGINAYTTGNSYFTHNGVRIADANDLAGKQDTLTFDSTPTEDSTNPVTSDGIYDALGGKQDTLQRYHENGVGYDVNITGTQGNLYLNSSYTSLDFGSNTSYIKLDGNGINAYTAGGREFNYNGSKVATASDLAYKQNVLSYYGENAYSTSLLGIYKRGAVEYVDNNINYLSGVGYLDNTNVVGSMIFNNSLGYLNLVGTTPVNAGMSITSLTGNYTVGKVEIDYTGIDIEHASGNITVATNGSGKFMYNLDEVSTVSQVNAKQDTLVSGTNIKTINNLSLLGSGNIDIQGGGSVTFDNIPTENSYNAAYSGGIYKVITDDELVLAAALNDLNIKIVQPNWNESDSASYAYIQNKPTIPTLVQPNWNEIDTSSYAYIQNKPDLTYMVTSSTTAGLKIAVVAALPATPENDTIYIVQ